jgi:hypothetical protein
MKMDNKYSEEIIEDTISRLRVCQISGLRVIGLVPKDAVEMAGCETPTRRLENVVSLGLRMTQGGPAPAICSIDFNAVPLPVLLVHNCACEYRISDLGKDAARAYAIIYLESVDDMCQQQHERQSQPKLIERIDARAMNVLNKPDLIKIKR